MKPDLSCSIAAVGSDGRTIDNGGSVTYGADDAGAPINSIVTNPSSVRGGQFWLRPCVQVNDNRAYDPPVEMMNLEPGESWTHEFSQAFGAPTEDWQASILVDINDFVDESDERNNRAARRGRSVVATAFAVGISVLLALVQPGRAAAQTTPTVPASLTVPAGNVPYLTGHARGYQIYSCQPQDTCYAWVLLAPWAGLVDDAGNAVAVHYAGPSWTGADASTVVAARVAGAPAPTPDAIPWLLLRATSTTGPPGGTFTSTTYIQRINTTGGLAPAGGCGAATVGALAPIYYTADYHFYRSG